MAKQYRITQVSNDGVFTEEEALQRFNGPLSEIQAALNELSSRMDTLSGKCSVLYEHAPITAACAPGTLVYYDTAAGRFAPARAALKAEPGHQGESVEAETSRVIGMGKRLPSARRTFSQTLSGVNCRQQIRL